MTGTKHTPNFNPNWVRNGKFCDGYFQATKVSVDHIDLRMDEYLFAQGHNMSGYWNDETKAELRSEYNLALAKAKEGA